AKCLDVELRSLGEELLILKRGVITLEPESIEKARARSAIVFNEKRVGRIYCLSPTQTSRFAMFLVVCIERQDESAVVGYIPHKPRAAAVKIIIAIGLTKSVLFAVIVVEIIAQRTKSAVAKVDNRRAGLFADDDARCCGHHFAIVVSRESRELFWFHERRFLAGIDSRAFNWWQRRVLDRINVEAASHNNGFHFGGISN